MKTKRSKSKKISVMEQFIVDFAGELDIFSSGEEFPDWVHLRHGELIGKLSPETRKIARRLREMNLRFRIKHPICINGSWKFADFYFPRQKTVIIVANPMSNFGPAGLDGERARFFKDRFRVIEVETLADLERKMAMKEAMAV